MNVVLAAAAGARHGLGHVKRSMALARALRAQGDTVTVLLCGAAGKPREGTLEGIALSEAPDAGALDAAAFLTARIPKDGWLVLDGYDLVGEGYYDACVARGARLLVLDDATGREIRAHTILNSALRDPSAYSGGGVRADDFLLGPTFALVDPDYVAGSWTGSDGGRILVSFGGLDRQNLAQRTLDALADHLRPLMFDLVLGPFANSSAITVGERHKLTVHRGLDTLAPLMVRADVMISSAGSTCWQACCVGTPLIAITAVANQKGNAALLRESGGAICLDAETAFVPGADHQAPLGRAVTALSSATLRLAYSAAARRLIDGEGARRAATYMRASRQEAIPKMQSIG